MQRTEKAERCERAEMGERSGRICLAWEGSATKHRERIGTKYVFWPCECDNTVHGLGSQSICI